MSNIDNVNLNGVIFTIDSGGEGLTDDVKVALLDCFNNVAWSGDDPTGQSYIDALESALYPPANLTRITATYTQSGEVYDNQTLDSLKPDLIVTAYFDNGTSQAVTSYVLSGTLTTGTSTITASYGGKTATFNVTVTHATVQYTISNNLTNCVNSNSAKVINSGSSYSGTLSASSGYVVGAVTITMGGTDITSTAYNSSTNAISIASVTGNIAITAEGVEDVGWVSGVPYDMTDGLIDNYYLNNGTETAYNGWAISPYLPCKGAFITFDTSFGSPQYNGIYDANKQYLTNVILNTGKYYSLDEQGDYLRVSGTKNNVINAVITPYRLPNLLGTTVWETDKYYTCEFVGDGYISSTDGTVISNNTEKLSDYLNCYNATLITDNAPYHTWHKYSFYDGDKQYISSVEIAVALSQYEIPVPSNARYFILSKTKTGFGVCFKLS